MRVGTRSRSYRQPRAVPGLAAQRGAALELPAHGWAVLVDGTAALSAEFPLEGHARRIAVGPVVWRRRQTARAKGRFHHVRKMAALSLGEIGEPVDVVVPALYEALEDADAGVRRRAAVALSEVLDESMTALLMVQARLSVEPPDVRLRLQMALRLVDGSSAAA
jgi:hypothetical protein